MAAYTIDYKPQFIKTDLGALQNKIDQTQQLYDQSMAGQMMAEDKFSEIPVTSSDVALKNEVLKGFADKSKSILERYGGDYAAAAKDLARAVSATSKDEFFQLAAYKNQLAEEQRKLAMQKGPEHIILKDVNSIALKDPVSGKYISKDQLGYNVTSATEVGQVLQKHFGDLANQVREGGYQAVKGMPWLLSATTYKGITQEEIPQVANDMYKYLKDSMPGINDATAQSIAFQEAKNLSKGFEHKETENFEYKRNAELSDYQTKLNMQSAQNKKDADIKAEADRIKAGQGKLPFFRTMQNSTIDENSPDIQKSKQDLKNFSTLAQRYYGLKNVVTQNKGAYENYSRLSNKAGGDILKQASEGFKYTRLNEAEKKEATNTVLSMLKIYDANNPGNTVIHKKDGKIIGFDREASSEISNNFSKLMATRQGGGYQLKDPIKEIGAEYNKAIQPFKKDPTFVEMTSKGVGPVEAASYVTNQRNLRKMVSNASDVVVNNDFKANLSEVLKAAQIEDVNKIYAEDSNPTISLDMNKRNITIVGMDKKGKPIATTISMDATKDPAFSAHSKAFAKFSETVYGPDLSMKEPVRFNAGNKEVKYMTTFNKDTKSYDKVLVINDPTTMTQSVYSDTPVPGVPENMRMSYNRGLALLQDIGTMGATNYYSEVKD